MDEGTTGNAGSGSNLDIARFEHAFLQRMPLQDASRVQIDVVADFNQSLIINVGAIIEDLPSDFYTQQPGNEVLKRGARKRLVKRVGTEFPMTLVIKK